jgi:hypothetical protein
VGRKASQQKTSHSHLLVKSPVGGLISVHQKRGGVEKLAGKNNPAALIGTNGEEENP